MIKVITTDLDKHIERMETALKVHLPDAIEKNAEDAARIMVTQVRKYIPAYHRKLPQQKRKSSGRLWSSFGIPDKRVKEGEYFDPSDAVLKIKKGSGKQLKFYVTVGTKVYYGPYANYGIGPGNRIAYYFIENGADDARDIIADKLEYSIEESLRPDVKKSITSRFTAATQTRDARGRFGQVIKL